MLGVVGADAPDAGCVCSIRHCVVDVMVVRAGEDEPGAVDVGGLERTLPNLACSLRELIADVRRHYGDRRPCVRQSDTSTRGHVATADDEYALAAQVEEQREPGVVHLTIVSPPPTC